MRIAFIVPHLEVGGVETFVFRLARTLLRAGHAIEIVATETPGRWFGQARELGLNATCLEYDRRQPQWAHATAVGRYLAQQQFDIVLLNHARFAQASLGLLPDHTVAVPIIHNDWEHVYEIGGGNPRAWNVGIAVSQKTFQTSASRARPKTMLLIPYGVDIPSRARLAERQSATGSLRLIYAGRLHHAQKGVLLFPDILAKCRSRGLDVFLTIIGEGPDGAALRERLNAAGLLSMTEFKGALSPENVMSELLAAHVLVLPSYYEGLPIVLLEALGAGCVPVTSRLEGVTDFAVSDRQSGLLVTPGNTDGFANALGELAVNRQLLRELSAAARHRAEKTFSLEAMGEQYLSFLADARAGRYALKCSRHELRAIDMSLLEGGVARALWQRLQRRVSRLRGRARLMSPPLAAWAGDIPPLF